MARVVGVKTVPEFVDQPNVLERLREIGIDFAQGYLLHKPEPIGNVFGAVALLTPVCITAAARSMILPLL